MMRLNTRTKSNIGVEFNLILHISHFESIFVFLSQKSLEIFVEQVECSQSKSWENTWLILKMLGLTKYQSLNFPHNLHYFQIYMHSYFKEFCNKESIFVIKVGLSLKQVHFNISSSFIFISTYIQYTLIFPYFSDHNQHICKKIIVVVSDFVLRPKQLQLWHIIRRLLQLHNLRIMSLI